MYLHGIPEYFTEVHSGIIGADEALRLLGEDRLTKFGRATLNAWDRYRARFAPIMAKPPARLRATAMHALMVEEKQGTRLTVGYILNSIGCDIAEIRLLAQDGNRIAWSREISVNQTVMPIFAPTTTTIAQAAPATKKRTLQAKAKLAKDRPGS